MADPLVPGVGPEAKVTVNDNGAKQSDSPYRTDLLPPLALLHVSKILAAGSVKYGDWNWLGLSVGENMNHALVHSYAWAAGDDQDDHPGHFACRALMALERYLRDELASAAAKRVAEKKVFGFLPPKGDAE